MIGVNLTSNKTVNANPHFTAQSTELIDSSLTIE